MDAAYYRKKADQEWDLAGLARQDRDFQAAERHTSKAKEYEIFARAAWQADKNADYYHTLKVVNVATLWGLSGLLNDPVATLEDFINEMPWSFGDTNYTLVSKKEFEVYVRKYTGLNDSQKAKLLSLVDGGAFINLEN